MNAAAPRSAVKGSEIVPNRCRAQGRVRHPRHESGRGETVSLDIAHSSISGVSQVHSEIQSADAGAKADSANVVMSLGGMKSHMKPHFHHALGAWVKGSDVASDC